MKSRPQVALLIETSNAYARGLLEGVTAYLREHGPWSVYISEHGRGDSVPHWLKGWAGDGLGGGLGGGWDAVGACGEKKKAKKT